jgi:signal-transduction protein with cAMP-binding, CBS, and nucleotidyltransferase domain
MQMDRIGQAIRQMIDVSEAELAGFLEKCYVKTFRRQVALSRPGAVPDEVYFVNRGVVRVVVTDPEGTEHTVHFALEDQFIADYAGFLLKQPGLYTLQAVEETEVVVLPRAAVEWGYSNLAQGEKLGRLVAEFYFIYHDYRIKNGYARTPKQRYDTLTEVFPNIYNRVPQHMIASYLGITPVHLSRLKKAELKKSSPAKI